MIHTNWRRCDSVRRGDRSGLGLEERWNRERGVVSGNQARLFPMKELPGRAYWRHGQPLFFTTFRLTWREFLQEGKGARSKTMSYLTILSSATVKISATSLVKGSPPGGWSRKWVRGARTSLLLM